MSSDRVSKYPRHALGTASLHWVSSSAEKNKPRDGAQKVKSFIHGGALVLSAESLDETCGGRLYDLRAINEGHTYLASHQDMVLRLR